MTDPAIATFLSGITRRIRVAFAIAATGRGLPIVGATALALVMAARLVSWSWFQPSAVVVVVGGAVVLGWAVVRVNVTPAMAARAADRSLGTNDALSTALQFES